VKAKAKSRPSKQTSGSVTIAVRIQPRASKNGIMRMEDGSLKIRLTAPPVDGAANEALIAYLSKALAVSKSSVEIVSGHTAREKRIKISGADEADVNQLLNTDKQ
jgi:uncharacterized protein (TIGR00251 family)